MSSLSGGNKRVIELMKRAENHGIEYVGVMDDHSIQFYQSSPEVISEFSYRCDTFADFLPLRPSSFSKAHAWKYPLQVTRSVEQLVQLARSEKVDLIYAPHEFMNLNLATRLASEASRIPRTCLLQLIPVVSKQQGTPTRLQLLRLRYYLRVARDTSLISVSRSIKNYLLKLDRRTRILCVDPGVGVDSTKFRPAGGVNHGFDAIFFARLIPEKGSRDILAIWKKVVESMPSSTLAVCGNASASEELRFKDQIRLFGLESNIKFLGYVEEEDLIECIQTSRLVVYPSRLDAFPLVVVEALACGKPVVAYNIEAIALNFGNISAVLRVPVGNLDEMARTVLNLLRDEELLSNLEAQAIAESRRFDWDAVLESERSRYEEIVDGYS